MAVDGADGNVVIKVKADISEAEKQFARLTRDIEKAEEALQKKESSRSALEKQLESAKNAAKETEKAISDLNAERERLEDARVNYNTNDPASVTASIEATEKITQVNAKLKEQTAELTKQNKEVDKLTSKYSKISDKVKEARDRLDDMRTEAGTLRQQIDKAANAIDLHLTSALGKAADSMVKFNKRIAGLAKRVLVFSVISRGFREIGDYILETAKKNNEFNASLVNTKAALKSAFQPILSTIVPWLTSLLDVVGKVAAAVSRLFSLLGMSVKVSSQLDDEAESLENVGNAASGAEKQLASFDEINKLSKSSGGGGSNQDTTVEATEIELPKWLEELTTKLALTIEDVFLDWDDLNPEQIAKKIITGITATLGGIAGFTIGGIPGAVIGIFIGAGIGLLVDTLLFDNDGKIGKKEVLKMVIAALGGLVGGIIGFKIGGLKGAMIGALIGISVSALISTIDFSADGHISNTQFLQLLATAMTALVGGLIGFKVGGGLGAVLGAFLGVMVGLIISGLYIDIANSAEATNTFYSTELGQWLQGIKEGIAERAELVVDLNARIASITGEIDSDTLADFELAQQLIDEIFDINESENLTATEINRIKSNIELLNTLNLDGIEVVFDDATGHVIGTREQVQGLYNDILKQYELEALAEDYKETYKAWYTATKNLAKARSDQTAIEAERKKQIDKVKDSENDLALAEENLRKHLEKYGDAVSKVSISEIPRNISQTLEQDKTYQSLQKAVEDATAELDEEQIALDELDVALSDAQKDVADWEATVDAGAESLNLLGKGVTDLAADLYGDGKNIMAGLKNGIEDGVLDVEGTMTKAMKTINGVERYYNEINSPSDLYKRDGLYMMEGLANGIAENAYLATDAMKDVVNNLAAIVERGINNIISKYNAAARELNKTAGIGAVQSATISRISIPRLAQGAVIPPNREFMAVLGDQKSGTNIEAPLSTIEQALRNVMRDYGGNQSEAVLEVDGEAFGRLVYKFGNAESRRVGANLVGG